MQAIAATATAKRADRRARADGGRPMRSVRMPSVPWSMLKQRKKLALVARPIVSERNVAQPRDFRGDVRHEAG